MSDVKRIMDFLERRISNREDALVRYDFSSLDSVPVDVLKLREIETQNIRLVIQEQKDILETLKLMFPDATNKQD